jgi:hypothetical protein
MVGEIVRIQVDAAGESIFGAIEQRMQQYKTSSVTTSEMRI